MDKDLRTIIVFGLRYALPRHTYAFSMVSDFILQHVYEFESWELEAMIDDCRIYYPDGDFGGAICDQPAVDKFKARLEDILKERKEVASNGYK